MEAPTAGNLHIPDDNMRSDSTRHDQLTHEFEQAWEHYRHLENLRNQYLSYALTVTLAALAASIPLSEVVGTNPQLLLVSSVLILAYTLLVAMTCAGVFKIRSLNNHYYLVILSVREHLLRGPSAGAFDERLLNRRRYGGKAPFGGVLSIQGWSEFVLLVLLTLATVASSLLARVTWAVSGVRSFYFYAVCAVAVLVGIMSVGALVVLLAIRRAERSVLRDPSWTRFRWSN
jgi:hypothetical protein